jgi:adenylate kinase
MEKMLNLVLFGPPGAGKGTQSEKLISKYGLVHLSTGDILRSEIARGTDLGRKAKAVMDSGALVGDEIVIGMIETKLDDNVKAKGFIFDGFPRTTAQAVALDDLLQKKGTGISGMLALEVGDEELVKRLLLRGKDSGRPDDKDENVIRKRIQEYNNKTLPLKKYYSEQGKFHSVHGIGSIEEIFQALVDRINFINAEMDLTSLETDIEHLDLTIKDFEVASDIEPELLLEIDAIKRAEAEEEEEELELKKKANTLLGIAENKGLRNRVQVRNVTSNGRSVKSQPAGRSLNGKLPGKTKNSAAKNKSTKTSKPLAATKGKKAVKKTAKKVVRVKKPVAKKASTKKGGSTIKSKSKKANSAKAVSKTQIKKTAAKKRTSLKRGKKTAASKRR